MNSDLKFLAETVESMPEGMTHIRLDKDGEICFLPESLYDFYPDVETEVIGQVFLPGTGWANVGKNYTREEFYGAKTILEVTNES